MRTLACFSLLALLLGPGCGDGTGDGTIKAKNKLTGEVKEFSSADDVDSGWRLCENDECTFPNEDFCNYVSPEVCPLTPGCHLEALYCDGQGDVSSSSSVNSEDNPEPPSDFPSPWGGPTNCLVMCVSDVPLTCGRITDVGTCLSNPACEWIGGEVPVNFPEEQTTCVDHEDGSTSCVDVIPPMPFPTDGFCQTRRFDPCSGLDETACMQAAGCEWLFEQYYDIQLIGCDHDGSNSSEPNPGCVPPPSSGMCVPTFLASCDFLDEQSCLARPDCELTRDLVYGCAVGGSSGDENQAPSVDTCVVEEIQVCRPNHGMICPPIALDYPADCDNPVPEFDDAGCMVGWVCVGCPRIEIGALCEGVAVPLYDPNGCLYAYACEVPQTLPAE